MNSHPVSLHYVGHLLWPEHILKDASSGTWLQRTTALHHNRRQAHLLPPYIRRWLLIAVVLLGGGTLLPLPIWVAATVLMMHAVSIATMATITAMWLMLHSAHDC